MIKFLCLILIVFSSQAWSQSSMRRCTLLPITDSVGGAIGFKVFEQIENDLRRSNWCSYISNSGMLGVFTRYRENLPQYLKTKKVLHTVADKLKVGSITRVAIINEVKGVEVQLDIIGENGEDIYFSEKAVLQSDDIELIASTVENWLDTYARTIPYDATVTGILGDQITLDVGKGYPIQIGQKFAVRRLTAKKKHPLLKKVVDWDTKRLAEGSIFNISDNQALGMIKVYKDDVKLSRGDWVRLIPLKSEDKITEDEIKKQEEEKPGTLGLLSLHLFGSKTGFDSRSLWVGNVYGFDFRAEGWITRQYFAAVELIRGTGNLSTASKTRREKNPNLVYSEFKLTGGYKYLPIGFFYGPQIDLYGGYANKMFDIDNSLVDGLGQATFSGLLLGVGANIPINREFRFYGRGEFLPFPSFTDEEGVYGDADSVSSLELEFGMKYQYTLRTTFDVGLMTRSNKAKFESRFKNATYKDNTLKVGTTINF